MSSYFLLLFWLCFVIFSFEMLEYFFFKLFISGFPGSSLLHVGFYRLQWVGVTRAVVLRFLAAERAPERADFSCRSSWA